MTKMTDAKVEYAKSMIRKDFREQCHAMLDDYLDGQDQGNTRLDKLILNVTYGGKGMTIAVVVYDPEEPNTATQGSAIEVVTH